MRNASEVLKIAGEVAEEALKIAEEKGLTLYEVLQVPETMRSKILYELRQQETPYKKGKAPSISTGHTVIKSCL